MAQHHTTSLAARVGFQGAFGAFSHEALSHNLPDAQPIPFETFAEVFDAVRSGECELGFVPGANSIAGPVPEVQALLPESGLTVIGEHAWPVRLQLMALPGVALADVRSVSSHPMALKQCTRALAELHLQAESAFDTAGAAEMLARSGDRRRAVVASRAAAELYGLEVLRADIQDRADNVTYFVVLRRAQEC